LPADKRIITVKLS